MALTGQNIQDKLNSCALIIRKYNLGDKAFFFSKFPNANKAAVETAWHFGHQKIQNREIIKDASDLRSADLEIITNKLTGLNDNPDRLYYYLNSEFDAKKLKLTDENIERNLRNKLAIKYLQVVSAEIFVLHNKATNSTKTRTAGVLRKLKYGLIAIAVVGIFLMPRIIKGLTPVETLAEQIHEKSKYKFNGAICNDGWTSHSQGRGTCSHHNGVDYYFYKGEFSKTIEECRKEAEEISWRK